VLAAAQAQLLLRVQLLLLVQLLLALNQRSPSHLTRPTAACRSHHQHMLPQQNWHRQLQEH
jgi:hypothetical protein